jgi:hypothetical protein
MGESGNTELCAAEVSRHDNEDIGEPKLLDRGKDRFACRPGGFAVIIETKLLGIRTNSVGKAVVRRIMKYPAYLAHSTIGLFLAPNRESGRNKSGPLHGELGFCAGANGLELVGHRIFSQEPMDQVVRLNTGHQYTKIPRFSQNVPLPFMFSYHQVKKPA